jgi:hypothetical protein
MSGETNGDGTAPPAEASGATSDKSVTRSVNPAGIPASVTIIDGQVNVKPPGSAAEAFQQRLEVSKRVGWNKGGAGDAAGETLGPEHFRDVGKPADLVTRAVDAGLADEQPFQQVNPEPKPPREPQK